MHRRMRSPHIFATMSYYPGTAATGTPARDIAAAQTQVQQSFILMSAALDSLLSSVPRESVIQASRTTPPRPSPQPSSPFVRLDAGGGVAGTGVGGLISGVVPRKDLIITKEL
jgi:hypothetical protein